MRCVSRGERGGTPGRGPKTSNNANRDLVRRVYTDIWIPQATNAFSAAALQKHTRADIPALVKDEQGNINLEERAEALATGGNFENQERILRRYMESLHTVPVDLRDDRIVAIEKEFKP